MDKEQTAIERLRMGAYMCEKIYHRPLLVTTSGGKDSSVVVELARRSGITFEVAHNHTTADAPETVRFMRQELARLEGLGIPCEIRYPAYKGKRVSMWSLIPIAKVPPTRKNRYCCDILKEQTGKGRMIVTGVRWAESKRRAKNHGVFEVANKNKEKRIVINDGDRGGKTPNSSRFLAAPSGLTSTTTTMSGGSYSRPARSRPKGCATPSLTGQTPTFGILSAPSISQ